MFVFNIKLSRSKKLLRSAALTVAVLTAACAAVSLSAGRRADTATCDEVGAYSLRVKDDGDAKAFLKQFGLNAVQKTGEERVVIPERFNSVYERYNDLQKRVGLDLTRYKGKAALKQTYLLKSSGSRFAVLLLCDGRVAGGHLTSQDYGGKDLPLVAEYGQTG